MERATVSRIESWDARPVSGGYAGLSDLAAEEFTGAVTADGARLFMLNGRVVGVFDGSLSAFDGAETTAYEAPHPALPLLFAMQERGGEVRGKYYTDDTPLQEVDATLTEGGFTGYLELSENVLSGDYYVVYYGGRSLSAAFVGNEGRVVTGQEAFDLAADEVGIYEVRSVDLEVSEIPEPSEGEAAAVAGTPDADEASPAEDDREPVEPEADDAAAADVSEDVPEDLGEPSSVEPTDEEPPTEDVQPGTPEAGASEDPEPAGTSEPSESGGDATASTSQSADTAGDAGGSAPRESSGRSPRAGSGGRERAEDPGGGPPRSERDERFREEERWREARTVPALDPDESELPSEAEGGGGTPVETVGPEPTQTGSGPDELAELRERVRELEAELESTEQERRRQAGRVEELIEERDELLEDREALERRIESLEARIEEQASLIDGGAESAGASAAEGSVGGNAIEPTTALDQTDLFVRYGSKGKATLQTAHDGGADREAVSENLRLETHSRFDQDGASVAGRPFEAYLGDTIEYRFVAWLIEDLLYEIRDTGTERGLRALYDALPEIDRAEFNGTVTGLDDEGDEHEEAFDVVCRDRMGKPLVVANINDSLDPATGDMMGDLVEDATAAGEAHDSLGAAFLVTASFFEPDALETASEATGAGFLSRDAKKSFVKLSRKGGYHLCLVEARGGEFHVAVPEF